MKRRGSDVERERLEQELAKAIRSRAHRWSGLANSGITQESLKNALRSVLEELAAEGEVILRPRVLVLTSIEGSRITIRARVQGLERRERARPATVVGLAEYREALEEERRQSRHYEQLARLREEGEDK